MREREKPKENLSERERVCGKRVREKEYQYE